AGAAVLGVGHRHARRTHAEVVVLHGVAVAGKVDPDTRHLVAGDHVAARRRRPADDVVARSVGRAHPAGGVAQVLGSRVVGADVVAFATIVITGAQVEDHAVLPVGADDVPRRRGGAADHVVVLRDLHAVPPVPH